MRKKYADRLGEEPAPAAKAKASAKGKASAKASAKAKAKTKAAAADTDADADADAHQEDAEPLDGEVPDAEMGDGDAVEGEAAEPVESDRKEPLESEGHLPAKRLPPPDVLAPPPKRFVLEDGVGAEKPAEAASQMTLGCLGGFGSLFLFWPRTLRNGMALVDVQHGDAPPCTQSQYDSLPWLGKDLLNESALKARCFGQLAAQYGA